MRKISLFFTDIDGVWTDGSMQYDEKGNESKKFTTYDSAGVLLLQMAEIHLVVISGEKSNSVIDRCKKLNIKHVHVGIKNKLKLANKVCKELNIKLKNCAHIGDELNDIHLLKKVGLSAAPKNANPLIKDEVDWVLDKSGGQGVFREFVEKYLDSIGMLHHYINKQIQSYDC
tara:strand:+ start:726 stop:1241 length:516 start_codon:yes stop_codon:yes gene_type:complete